MVQIFGDFRELIPSDHEFLLMGFSSSSFPLQNRWRNNGLSANFIADYLSTFFPTQVDDKTICNHHAEIKSSVSYIANELLENAMKFNVYEVQFPIRFGLHLLDEEGITVVLSTTNCVSCQSIEPFQEFIQELLTTDLDELYVRQLERSEDESSMSGSGLGFITIKNDYNAKLGWKFEDIQTQDDKKEANKAVVVTTMVQLRV